MFTKLLISIAFTLLTSLSFPYSVLANDPVQLSSPSEGSTVSSSKLEWQIPSYALYSGNNYRVQVDDDSAFSSLNKDYYTDNNYYTPTLTGGIWYWRVKAKDAGGVWSDWSGVWSFTLTSSSSTPTPSPSDSADPTPTPIPTSTPQPTPQPTSSQSSAFLISNTPSQVNSDDGFSVAVNLSLPNHPNTQFYLKGAFKQSDSLNYFGFTKVSGSWVKNGSSYSSQYLIITDSEGNWSGNLEVKDDSEDSGFEGTGDYIFKVGRYTSSGSGPTWSNEITIKIVGVVNSDSDSVSQGSSQSTKKASSSLTSSAAKSNSSGSVSSKSNLNGSIYRNTSIASVAAASIEPSSTPEIGIKAENEINYIPIVGGFLVLSGIISLGFIYLKKKRANETNRNIL